MERGDIYLVCLDPTAGHEQQGTRPVLLVAPTAFNRLTRTPIVLPITNGDLDLGPWEQVFYAEFDGRRRKRVVLKVMGE